MIKLISVNIQTDMHHDKVLSFLEKEQPDVVCLQELFEDDRILYEKALNMTSFFKPMCYFESFTKADGKQHLLGPAIFTKHNVEFNHEYLVGDEANIPIFEHKNSETIRDINNLVLIWSDIKDASGEVYRISTTHSTWTPDGKTTPYQIEDTSKIIKTLDEKLKDFVLVGDLNAPRGKEAFAMLANKYKDNIPEEYDTSLDPNLHRIKLKRMVDGLFSTKEYKVTNVKFVEGVSDHKAIVANIEKI